MTKRERAEAVACRDAELADFDAAQARSLGLPEGALVAGIDEAGRGPLFGPVYAGCVVLRAGQIIPGVYDSKRLSAKARAACLDAIRAMAVAVGVGTATVAEIERHNILGATRLAMQRAARMAAERSEQAMGNLPACYLVDAVGGLRLPAPTAGIVRGDTLSMAVAAASIAAKVERDALMAELDARYPGYGIARHKGYASREHIEALRALGPTPEHRPGFLTKILAETRP